MSLPRIKTEIPVWRGNEKMEDTLIAINAIFLLQIRKLNVSRRSSLSSRAQDEKPQEAILDFGSWNYLWGNKVTAGSETDRGILNIGKVIGKEFILNEESRNRRNIEPDISYRYDWDNVKGKHFNTVELFKSTQTPQSSPKFIKTVEKAYLYNDKLKYLYDSEIASPRGDERSGLDEYIRQSRPEVDKEILKLTIRALKDGATMSSDVGQQILQHFMMEKAYLVNYFREFKGVLRPMIDCARTAYLNNSGEHKLDNDQYTTLLLHQRVTNYTDHLWKKELTEILKLIVAIKKLNSEPNKEEQEQKLESKEKALKDLCDSFLLSDAKEILFNEIHHALHGNTGRNAILRDLITVFDKIPESSITEELFNRVGIDSEYEEFAKLILKLPYRQEYLMAHEADLEPIFEKPPSVQPASSQNIVIDDRTSSDNIQHDEIDVKDDEEKPEADDQDERSGFRY